jgi:hypothetical protein
MLTGFRDSKLKANTLEKSPKLHSKDMASLKLGNTFKFIFQQVKTSNCSLQIYFTKL